MSVPVFTKQREASRGTQALVAWAPLPPQALAEAVEKSAEDLAALF
jgi:hypothetical protein